MTTIHQIIEDAPDKVSIPPVLRHQRIEIIFRSRPIGGEALPSEPVLSFFDLTRDDCGAIKGGPDDVSCNADYLAGLGE